MREVGLRRERRVREQLRLGLGGQAQALRDIVRAIIAAAIGVANEVPSHAAQPPKAIVGSVGLVVRPCATFVFSRVNVDCRFDPRAMASTHAPWLL